ncbi:acyl carrier protein 3, mitochondrial [Nymphaea colorata]|nr:acyl carrier protein 3, mitochondrial [Nymphaea colorata]
MHHVQASILKYVRLRNWSHAQCLIKNSGPLITSVRHMCGPTIPLSDNLMSRVLGLVKKFDKIDAAKVTETADFQKDLCLDSLDRVDLVMAFEAEFNIEIPDEKADKLTCCADVAKYILSESNYKIPEES